PPTESLTAGAGSRDPLSGVDPVPPHPNPSPQGAPRRGSRAFRTQVETTSMWQGLAIVLPLLGERVGVRGTGAHDYPWLTHWNHRGTAISHHSTNRSPRNRRACARALPLPKGEGRGEGEERV